MNKLFSKTLCVLLLLWGSMATVNAQETYRELIKEYMTVSGGQYSQKEMANVFIKIGEQLNLDEQIAQKLGTQYCEEVFMPGLLSVVEESFKANMTTDELKTFIKYSQTDEGQVALAHMQQLYTSGSKKKIEDAMGKALMDLIAGKQPAKLEEPDCPAFYKKSYINFCKVVNMQNMLESTFSTLKQMFGSSPEASELIGKITNYVEENSMSLLLNIGYGVLTDSDIKYLTKIYSTPEGQKVVAASGDMMEPLMSYTIKNVTEYAKEIKRTMTGS